MIKQFYVNYLGDTALSQSGPNSDDNEGLFCIPKAPHHQII